MLTQMAYPCSDAKTCDETDKVVTTDHHDHSEDEDDNCTPFCFCNCCGVAFTVNVNAPFFSFAETPLKAYIFHYKFNYSHEHLENVWHPPTVS